MFWIKCCTLRCARTPKKEPKVAEPNIKLVQRKESNSEWHSLDPLCSLILKYQNKRPSFIFANLRPQTVVSGASPSLRTSIWLEISQKWKGKLHQKLWTCLDYLFTEIQPTKWKATGFSMTCYFWLHVVTLLDTSDGVTMSYFIRAVRHGHSVFIKSLLSFCKNAISGIS